MRIELEWSSDAFVLLSGDSGASYKLKIVSALLHVPMNVMQQEVYESFLKIIAKRPSLITIRRSAVTPHVVPINSTLFYLDSVFPGEI